MLAPQQRVHRQLDLVGRAALLLADELVLGAREAERERVLDGRRGGVARRSDRGAFRGDPRPLGTARDADGVPPSRDTLRHVRPSTARRIDSKIVKPSVEPR